MNRYTLLVLLAILHALSFNSYSQSAPTSTLRVTFEGLRNGKGNLITALGDVAKDWPASSFLDSTLAKSNGSRDHMTMEIKGLQYGTYAFTVFDDENKSADMDTFMGIPREGYGFSNNPKVRMGAPGFEECAFVINRPLVEISIRMNYLKKEKDQ